MVFLTLDSEGGNTVSVIISAVVSALSIFIELWIARRCFFGAFSKLGKNEQARKYFPMFFVGEYSLAGFANYAVNIYGAINGLPKKPQPQDIDGMQSYLVRLTPFYCASLIGAVLSIIVIISMFHLLDRLTDDNAAVVNGNKFLAGYSVLIIASLVTLAVSCLRGRAPEVLTAVITALELASAVLILCLVKNKQRMNSDRLAVSVPTVLTAAIVALRVASPIVSLIFKYIQIYLYG